MKYCHVTLILHLSGSILHLRIGIHFVLFMRQNLHCFTTSHYMTMFYKTLIILKELEVMNNSHNILHAGIYSVGVIFIATYKQGSYKMACGIKLGKVYE